MYLKEQIYICQIAECGTLSEAARRLYITQPALSNFLSKLELNLGGPLFYRQNGLFIPTYLGERYINTAAQMIKLQEAFNLEKSAIVKNESGRFRIGVQTRRSPEIIPKILHYFHENYPNFTLVFEESNTKQLFTLLESNAVDFIITSISRRMPTWNYIPIKKEGLLVALSKEHRLITSGVIDPEQNVLNLKILAKEFFILPHGEQSLRQDLDRIFRAQNFVPQDILEIRSIATAMSLVSRNMGVGFTRESYVDMKASDDVVYFFVEHANLEHLELVAVSYKSSAASPFFRTIMENVASSLKA
ncbi:LysR family transcriptional regulator [Peptoniphilus equinus]|uniref:LysR family transcriptional regulator n=1 Tax=Peptoniphilus equinus TaxID=3016343 RepID=A0ABY7QVG8_9FIRM|nr:LysR family transcriptional regulator [Peptoniphilus equinus]WBW50035.1 LysR family transcriptional regulator [Peptoniphilus equinus]